jgi:dienelactone hydrolase
MKKIILSITAFILAIGCQTMVKRTEDIPPTGNGAYEVASSNLELNAGAFNDSQQMVDYLRGIVTEGFTPYGALTDQSTVFTYSIEAANDPYLYESKPVEEMQFYGVVFYPTDPENGDADYTLPRSKFTLPKMQRKGKSPKILEKEKYPLIIFSHGGKSHPLYEIGFLSDLASHGYIVVAPFHYDIFYGKDEMPNPYARAASVRGAIDALQSDVAYASHIDFDRIAISGISFGGFTSALVCGAAISGPKGPIDAFHDPRIKAAAVHIPYMENIGPFTFDWSAGLQAPFIGISGEKDSIAPWKTVQEALSQSNEDSYLILMEGVGHSSSKAIDRIRLTITLHFLDAYLDNDEAALSLLKRIKQVERAPQMEFVRL